jgi:fatty-acyl-CoA synthase
MTTIHKTIGQAIAEIAKTYYSRDALIHTEMAVRYDYGQLSRQIDRTARGFLHQGVKKGDRIALWSSNIPEWIFSMLALAKIGALVVPIDPAASVETLHYILKQSESYGLIVAGKTEDSTIINTALAAKNIITSLEEIFIVDGSSGIDAVSWNELMAGSEKISDDGLAKSAASVSPEDPVAIMYTSGTTGRPKGVVLDHLGLINKSMVATKRQGLSTEDRLCLFFPLFHMFGNTCIALAGLLRGAALIMPCQKFDPVEILTTIPAEKCTAIYGSPSMLITLVDHPQFRKNDWISLTKGIIGGAPCPMELMRKIVEDIGISDITVAYGITETSSWITMTHPQDPIELRVSTIGRPLDCNQVKIVDPVSGRTLGPDRQGELCTRGFLMKEYYKMPAATAAAIDRENWFHTGDLSVMDGQGYVSITGRLKDVIVRDRLEIHPVEVEEIIYMLPEISEVQVFGFLDANRKQEIAAWIKLKQGSNQTLASIAEHVRKHLPAEKNPKYYKIVSEFPMTGSGKIQKFKMAEVMEKEQMDAQDQNQKY